MESIPAGFFRGSAVSEDDELQELRVPRQPTNVKMCGFLLFGFFGRKKIPGVFGGLFFVPWERLSWLKCEFFPRHPLPPAELRRREGSPQKKGVT